MNRLNIKIIGLGEGGAKVVGKMISAKIGNAEVEFICAGMDENIMLVSDARKNIFLNRDMTTLYKNFSDALSGANVIFIVGGLGSNSARAAVPIITCCAKNIGAVTIAFMCRPFVLENFLRKMNADYTLNNLRGKVDTLFDVPAEKFFMLRINQAEISLNELFDVANEIFCRGVKIFLDILQADANPMLCRWGNAAFGYGEGKNPLDAIKSAAKFPTLNDDDIKNADGILVSIIGKKILKLTSVEAANDFVRHQMKSGAEFFSREDVDATQGEKVFAAIICTRNTPNIATDGS